MTKPHPFSSVSFLVTLSISGVLSRTVTVNPPLLNSQQIAAANGLILPSYPSVGSGGVGSGWNTPPSIPTPSWGPPPTIPPGWPAPTDPPTTIGWTTPAPPTTIGWTTAPPPTTLGWTTAPPPTTIGWTTAPPPTTIGWTTPPPTTGWTTPPPTTTGWPAPLETTTPGWPGKVNGWAQPTTIGWSVPETTAGWTTAIPTTTPGWSPPSPKPTPGWVPAISAPGWSPPATTAVEIEMEGEAAVVGAGAAGATHNSNTVVIGDSTNLATLDVYTGSYATLGQEAGVTQLSSVDPVSGESSTVQVVEGSNFADSGDFYEGHITGNFISMQNEGSSFAVGQGAIGLAAETENESVTLVR